jgi:hypothetical protein
VAQDANLLITIPKTPPPSILYKYFPPERVDVIEGTAVRFSPPSQFNDAFDTFHLLPAAAALRVKAGRRTMRDELGVLCLTGRPDDHVMWVNYARNHTGFVVGFDAYSEFFREDHRELRKVIYQDSPPIFDAPSEDGCFYKSPEWRYENEWRCIRSFQDGAARHASFEWSMIKQIIFGHKMAQWLISDVIYSINAFEVAYGTAPEILFSKPSHTEWKFINQARKVHSCEHCNGKGYNVL